MGIDRWTPLIALSPRRRREFDVETEARIVRSTTPTSELRLLGPIERASRDRPAVRESTIGCGSGSAEPTRDRTDGLHRSNAHLNLRDALYPDR